MIVYDSDLGEMFQFIAGSWGTIDTGTSTPNASTTVAGKVEIATQSENNAGTATGGTGALLVATPDVSAVTNQTGAQVYAASTTGNDTYVVTLSPAITAYTNGMEIRFKPDTANTGNATLNVNGLGAFNILKNHDQTLETGDIEANQIVVVVFNDTGTDCWELQTPSAAMMSTANSATLTAGASSNADALHTHSNTSKRIQNIYTPVTVVSTTSETDLVSVTVPGGTLSTTNAIRVRLYCPTLSVEASSTVTFRFKYGGTTFITSGMTNVVAGVTGAMSGMIEFLLMANNSAATQVATSEVNFITNGVNTTFSNTVYYAKALGTVGSTAVDSTSNQTLAVSVQHGASGASATITMTLATVEVIA